MIFRKGESQLKTSWFEEWLDITFLEKLVTIIWCGMAYILWLVFGDLITLYRVVVSIGTWIVLTLLTWWFGKFMGSEDRHWN